MRLASYLHIVDRGVVARIAPCGIPCRGKSVRREVDEIPAAGVCHGESGNRDCLVSAVEVHGTRSHMQHTHRVWSAKCTAAASSGLLPTLPIPGPGPRRPRLLCYLDTLSAGVRMRGCACGWPAPRRSLRCCVRFVSELEAWIARMRSKLARCLFATNPRAGDGERETEGGGRRAVRIGVLLLTLRVDCCKNGNGSGRESSFFGGRLSGWPYSAEENDDKD